MQLASTCSGLFCDVRAVIPAAGRPQAAVGPEVEVAACGGASELAVQAKSCKIWVHQGAHASCWDCGGVRMELVGEDVHGVQGEHGGQRLWHWVLGRW